MDLFQHAWRFLRNNGLAQRATSPVSSSRTRRLKPACAKAASVASYDTSTTTRSCTRSVPPNLRRHAGCLDGTLRPWAARWGLTETDAFKTALRDRTEQDTHGTSQACRGSAVAPLQVTDAFAAPRDDCALDSIMRRRKSLMRLGTCRRQVCPNLLLKSPSTDAAVLG